MDYIDTLQQTEDSLESLPKEVKDFLYKGRFDDAVKTISDTFYLSDNQKKGLDYHLTRLIALVEHRDDIVNLCKNWQFDESKKALFLDAVEKNILIPILETTNYLEEFEDDNQVADDTGTASNSSSPDIFQTLKSRLVEAKTVAPIARDHSIDSGETPKKETPGAQRIDPYREIPK